MIWSILFPVLCTIYLIKKLVDDGGRKFPDYAFLVVSLFFVGLMSFFMGKIVGAVIGEHLSRQWRHTETIEMPILCDYTGTSLVCPHMVTTSGFHKQYHFKDAESKKVVSIGDNGNVTVVEDDRQPDANGELRVYTARFTKKWHYWVGDELLNNSANKKYEFFVPAYGNFVVE